MDTSVLNTTSFQHPFSRSLLATGNVFNSLGVHVSISLEFQALLADLVLSPHSTQALYEL